MVINDIILDEFIKWFFREENYKKSYLGLVQKEVLKGWNHSFFNNKLFSIDLNNPLFSLNEIEKIVNDKQNTAWIKYSESSSRGAPQAVLGRNNYLGFLDWYINKSGKILELAKKNKVDIDVYSITNDFIKLELNFTEPFIKRFFASISTKPFLILTGLSGSGKTKLAQVFVYLICEHHSDVDSENSDSGRGNRVVSDQYLIVPVGSDWTNREPLLGYPDALNPEQYILPDSGVLQLILRAQKNKDRPYFLILDEMNLSHVERYFADFLSTMESNESIPLHSVRDGLKPAGMNDGEKIPESIRFPDNLFIIGTVNIDETTHMFSPKVLDRANTIEFRISPDEMAAFLEKDQSRIEFESLKGQGSGMAASFLEMYRNRKPIELDDDSRMALNEFFVELGKTGAEFGYRTANEIRILLQQLQVLESAEAPKVTENAQQVARQGDLLAESATRTSDDSEAYESSQNVKSEHLDIAIMQKLLPKLHGSRNKLVRVLETLARLCLSDDIRRNEKELNAVVEQLFSNDASRPDINSLRKDERVRFPLSLEKIVRMHRNAVENGFTSFAEA
jgi:5-methylcytosine-specific restriction enzyme B